MSNSTKAQPTSYRQEVPGDREGLPACDAALVNKASRSASVWSNTFVDLGAAGVTGLMFLGVAKRPLSSMLRVESVRPGDLAQAEEEVPRTLLRLDLLDRAEEGIEPIEGILLTGLAALGVDGAGLEVAPELLCVELREGLLGPEDFAGSDAADVPTVPSADTGDKCRSSSDLGDKAVPDERDQGETSRTGELPLDDALTVNETVVPEECGDAGAGLFADADCGNLEFSRWGVRDEPALGAEVPLSWPAAVGFNPVLSLLGGFLRFVVVTLGDAEATGVLLLARFEFETRGVAVVLGVAGAFNELDDEDPGR